MMLMKKIEALKVRTANSAKESNGAKEIIKDKEIINDKEKNTAEEKSNDFTVRTMTIDDYEGVYALWKTIKGFSMRSIDDSFDGVKRFLSRNPATSIVAEADGKIVGAILCGHDGRRATFYHVCVAESFRKRGIGKAMVVLAMQALKKEKINKVALIAFTQNDVGNAFWKGIGWKERLDLNYYDFTLNSENIEKFNE